MKINISIDILPSEVCAILEHLKGQEKTSPPKAEEEENVHLVRVEDNEMNQKNEFWKERIGRIGRVVEERAGMWDVRFSDDPFPCKDIDPQRFTTVVR